MWWCRLKWRNNKFRIYVYLSTRYNRISSRRKWNSVVGCMDRSKSKRDRLWSKVQVQRRGEDIFLRPSSCHVRLMTAAFFVYWWVNCRPFVLTTKFCMCVCVCELDQKEGKEKLEAFAFFPTTFPLEYDNNGKHWMHVYTCDRLLPYVEKVSSRRKIVFSAIDDIGNGPCRAIRFICWRLLPVHSLHSMLLYVSYDTIVIIQIQTT